MPSQKYFIGSPEGLRLTGQSLQIAKALSFELGAIDLKLLSKRCYAGLIELNKSLSHLRQLNMIEKRTVEVEE